MTEPTTTKALEFIVTQPDLLSDFAAFLRLRVADGDNTRTAPKTDGRFYPHNTVGIGRAHNGTPGFSSDSDRT